MNASEMAKALGRRGGRARARRLSNMDKKRIASLGGKARAQSLEAARRIATNFRYATAVTELRALREQPPRITRLRTFADPLPGVYPSRS
jgi:hypothetical protein